MDATLSLLGLSILVGLAGGACLSILQLTDLLGHLLGKESTSDAIDKIENKYPWIAEMLECSFCSGTWICLVFSLLAKVSMHLPFALFLILWPASIAIAAGIREAFELIYIKKLKNSEQ